MAQSKIGGAFGYLRKSIGGVTYSAPKLGISQKRVQVARTKATEVSNPNSIGQIMQRMKIAPASRFFSAYETVVNKGIMSHSFEKVKYGQASRLYFNQQALKKEDAVHVPYGVDFFVPGEYLVSEGSLLSLPWRKELAAAPATALLDLSQPLTAAQITALADYNVAANDQITVMVAIAKNGRYEAGSAYITVAEGHAWNFSSATITAAMQGIKVGAEGSFVAPASGATEVIAGLAVIVSRGRSESNDARSTETFFLVNGYQSLRSPEALQAAIDSYLTKTAVNGLNSDWYLNQGNRQAFNGRVEMVFDWLKNGDLSLNVRMNVLCGVQINGDQLQYVVFTDDGSAGGQVYGYGDSENEVKPIGDIGGVTPEGTDFKVSPKIGYAILTPEIAAQGGFTLGA